MFDVRPSDSQWGTQTGRRCTGTPCVVKRKCCRHVAIVRRHGGTPCVVKREEVLQAYGDSSQAWGHAVRCKERSVAGIWR